MNLDLSRSELESLLTGFLVGALGVEPKAQVRDLTELPEDYSTRVRKAESQGCPWVAWSTDRGLIVIWADLDIAASQRLHAVACFLGWYGETFSEHGMWCYCYPNRPTEWIVGRNRPE